MRTEQFGPAAVMGERGERVEGRKIALHGAEIGFQRPESGDDGSRNPIGLLRQRKGASIFFHPRRPVLQAVVVDHAAGKLDEILGEHALRAVAGENTGVETRLRQRVEPGRADAFGAGLARHRGAPGFEIAAALLGRRGTGNPGRDDRTQGRKPDFHRNAFRITPCPANAGPRSQHAAATGV
jgi:hypothetical protein